MNIAIFTNNYLPNPFGVSGSIESFRHQFEKHGHTVFIFAPRSKNYVDENPNACPTENFSNKNFGRVFRYPSIDFNYKISFPIAIPFSRKIDKIIGELKIDIIHAQHSNLLGGLAAKWAKKKNIPLVFTWHTLYDYYVHFAPLIPKKWALRWVINNAVNYANRADQIVTPTESVIPIIQKWGVTNKNITAIATGIEEKYYQNADRNLIRQKFHVKNDEILLLLVSRLTQEKNIEFLFNSVIKVLKNNVKTKFLIAGDGNLSPKLKNIVLQNNLEDRILFEGIVSKENLKNYYAAGDIFVYTSKSETQGMIVSEAMYLGLPIVAVNAPGVSDLVRNNKNGFLVSENESEFSSAVQKLIDEKELRNKFSKESKKIARENFTDKICAEKMLHLYQSLLTIK
jgi:1,2-diacylglycerol 3-alpha-glucosyltransferase